MSKQILTQDRLRELLNYDPETGLFTWLVRRGRIAVGHVAGSKDTRGYGQIVVQGHPYRSHRLAWYYTHGVWPIGDIDHINGNRTDNRLANLRVLTRTQNCQNQRRARVDNKSGYLGVSLLEGKWSASISFGGKQKYLGRYATPEEAHAVYLEAKRKHHEGCTI